MARIVDLRSDTVTLPTPAMRRAMYEAEVGDDVYGEDPTINRLEELSAERLGKEAAMFVASGTMGNLVSVLTHCTRGDEVILGDQAHIFRYEAGGVSALGGVMVHTVPNLPNGMLDPDDVVSAFRDASDYHFPRTTLICLENTHNRCGGRVLRPSQMAEIKAVAGRLGVPVHLDGARIFDAAVSLGIEAKEIAAQADSIQFCYSKGLAAPVGSAVCGSEAFVQEARRTRKLVGGGMRQGGILAAAAIVAMDEMVDRLAEDHINAKTLAEGLEGIDGLGVDLDTVESNILMVDVMAPGLTAAQVAGALTSAGVKVNAMGPQRIRAVTHYGVDSDDTAYAIDVAQGVMDALT